MRFVIELSPHLFVCKSLPGNLITLLIYGGGRGLTGRSFQEIGESVWTDEERGSSTVLPSRHQLHRMWCLVPVTHGLLGRGHGVMLGLYKVVMSAGGQGCCPLKQSADAEWAVVLSQVVLMHQNSKPGLFITLFFFLLLLLKHWKDLMRRWPNNWVLCHPYTSQVGIHWSTRVMGRNGWLKMTTSKMILCDLYSQNFWFHSGLSAHYQGHEEERTEQLL